MKFYEDEICICKRVHRTGRFYFAFEACLCGGLIVGRSKAAEIQREAMAKERARRVAAILRSVGGDP